MKLVYVHVPKCAGTTVITALRGVYGDTMYHDADFRRIKQRHLAWRWSNALPLVENKLSIEDSQCVAGHFTWKKYAYLQWPMFIFLRNPFDRSISQYSIGNNREVVTFQEYVKAGANSIARMVGDLDRYFFVGIQEHFEESMQMLEYFAGIQFTWPLVYRNHHKRDKYVLSKEDHKVLVENSTDDIMLYDQARVRFYQQRAEYYEWQKEQVNTT